MSEWLDTIFHFLKVHWPDPRDFFSSVFFMAIAGSLAGAFAGARAAQRMADKSRIKDELIREIRSTNAAVMLAFGIANTLLSAKKQHIKSLKETFERHKLEAKDAIAKLQAGTGGEFRFQADFRTLPILQVPISLLQTLIFEKISLQGRPIILAATLAQTIEALNASIANRNQLVERFKASKLPDNQVLALYLGFAYEGRLNQEYAATVEAIYKLADDAILSSAQLCGDLSSHGDELSAAFKKRFGRGAPRIHKPDFSKAAHAHLMPSKSEYGSMPIG